MVGLSPAQITSSTDLATPSALASGTPPLGSFGGSGFDKVNLYNGNVNFSIPVASLGGRNGLGVTLTLSYNSKVWRVENEVAAGRYGIPLYFYSFVAGPYIGPGWMLNVGSMIRRQSSWLENNTTAKTLTNITFTAPDGTQYDFRDSLSNGQPFSLPYNNERTLNGASRGFIFHTSDGTSATFISKTDNFSADLPINDFYNADGNAPDYPSGFVILRNGTRFKVFKGKVVEQQDSNGNIVRFLYNGNQLTQIIDTLGRSIDVAYSNSTSSPIVATITTKGVGGVSRVTEIKRNLLSDDGVLFGEETLKKLAQLFPDLDTTGGSRRPPMITFNPSVITEISLPDDRTGNGHKWQFQYNSYGEIAKVFTPSNGAIEYSHIMTPVLPDPGNRPGPEIFRRVFERKVYASKTDSTPRGRTTYTDPTVLDSNNNSVVTETSFDQSGQRLAVTQHKFVNSPADNYGVNTNELKNTGYRPWMEGKEIQTEEIELNAFGQNTGRRRITNYFYEQREGVSWVSGSNNSFLNQPENDPRLVRVQTQLEDGSTSKVDYEYDLFNNVTLETVTGFNNQVLRKTQRSYLQTNPFQSGVNYRTDLSIHLRSLLLSETIIGINPINGLETIETSTTFEYDRYSSSSLVSLSFSPLDNSRNPSYGSSYQTRGNVTSIIRGLVGNQSIINTQYDIAGNVIKTQGPLATQEVSTTYDSDHFAFPIRTTQVVPGAPSSFVLERNYDLHTGVILSSTGFNKNSGEVTNYFYNDPLDRLTRVVRPAGTGQTEYSYSSASAYPNTVTVETTFDSSSSLSSTTFYDGLLNPIKSTRLDPQGSVTTETTYDGLGRVVKITNPQRGTASVDTNGSTETTYDGFGRVLSVESFDKNNTSTGKVTSIYDGHTVTVTDQSGKQRRSFTDALGRLISVFEPDDSGVLSLDTNYSYDARGNLLRVSQSIQNRTFIYDSLGRLTSATAPESGTTTYIYDSASNLISRTDARNITTTFTYDALNRVKTKNYSDSTPSVSYFYDGNPSSLPSGATFPPAYQPGTALGRLVAVATPTTARESATGTFYTYDVPGRIISSVQLTEGSFFANSATYNQASLIEQHTYPSQKVVTNTYQTDNAISNGQLATVSRDGQSLSTELRYNAAGALEQQKLGNELFHNISYNSRLQPVTISLGSTASGDDKFRLDYNYSQYDFDSINNATTTPNLLTNENQNNGNIGSIRLTHGIGTNPIDQFFAYDELNRLKLAKEFAVVPPSIPQITSFSPDLICNRTTFTITGSNLANVTELVFSPSTGINVFSFTPSDNEIIADILLDGSALGEHTLTVKSGNVESNQITFFVVAGGQEPVSSSSSGAMTCRNDGGGGDGGSAITYIKPLSEDEVCLGYDFNRDNLPSATGEANFSFDLTSCPNLQNATLYTGWGISVLSQFGLGADTLFEIFINGNLIYSKDLIVRYDVNGDVISSTGQCLLGNCVIGNEPVSGGGVIVLDDYIGQIVNVTYKFQGSTIASPSGNRPFFSGGVIPIVAYQPPLTTDVINNDLKTTDSLNPILPSTYTIKTLKNNSNSRIKSTDSSSTSSELSASPSWSQQYSYDRFGNRLSVAGTNEQTLDISSSNNRINASGYSYDPAGNLIADSNGKFFFYDAENHLIIIAQDDPSNVIANYFYDGNGRRVKKAALESTLFVYDLAGRLIAEYNSSPSPSPDLFQKEYVFGASGLLATFDSSQNVEYLTPDHLGSPRIVTGEFANVVSRRDFHPFGEDIDPSFGGRSSLPGYDTFDSTRQRFTGYEKDLESGLDFAQARYYSSNQGRFTSVDPIIITASRLYSPQQINLYSYVLNNPLNLTDPTGEKVNFADDFSRKLYEEYKTKVSILASSKKQEDTQKATQLQATIEQLESSDVVYTISVVTNDDGFKSGETEGAVQAYEREDGYGVNVIIRNIGGAFGEKFILEGRFAHELEHARQFDNGELNFFRSDSGKDEFEPGFSYDIYDEVNAFNAQLSITSLINVTSDTDLLKRLRLAKNDEKKKAGILQNSGTYNNRADKVRNFERKDVPPGTLIQAPNLFGRAYPKVKR